MTLAHCQEVLHAHMNHSNWKKLINIGLRPSFLKCVWCSHIYHFLVPSLLKCWAQMETAMDLSANAFDSLSTQLGKNTKQWLKADQHAQLTRQSDSSIMDMYDTSTVKGLDVFIPCELLLMNWQPHLVWMSRQCCSQKRGRLHLPMVRHFG